jgi:hypothetical protein
MAFADDERREEPPNFWNELYWFGLISLGGLALALLVLAPKLAKHRSTLDTEDGLRAAVARLDLLEKQYEAAIEAMENDPFYREEVLRAVLKVKKSDEVLLKESARNSDN